MNAIEAIRANIRWGNQIVDLVMADVTDEQARWLPPGAAHPVGAIYAHALLAQDGIVNGMLKGRAPRFATDWADRTGLESPQQNLTPEWSRGLRPDLAALRQYGQVVIADTEAYLDGLTADDLDRTIDLSAFGLGEPTVGWILNALVAGHLNNMAGEISALKGVQGARGYPF
jgi:hypothetical protein